MESQRGVSFTTDPAPPIHNILVAKLAPTTSLASSCTHTGLSYKAILLLYP